MRYLATGVELSWDEYFDLLSTVRQVHESASSCSVKDPATAGALREIAAVASSAPGRPSIQAVKQETPRKKGRQPNPRIDMPRGGVCPIHDRSLVKDPDEGTWNCTKCLDESED